MIETRLRIIFHHEDCGLVPIRAVAYLLHQLTNGVIVIGDHGPRGILSRRSSRCMVSTESEQHQLRHLFLRNQSIVVSQPNSHAGAIAQFAEGTGLSWRGWK